jgi:recombination protein RecA
MLTKNSKNSKNSPTNSEKGAYMALDDKRKSASSEFDGMSGDKQKALTAALAQIEKQFGKGSIMRLGDAEIHQDIQVVSSGSLG